VEHGAVGDFMRQPLHPYSLGLMGATVHGSSRGAPLTTIPGAPPALDRLPPGCSFAPRCTLAEERCRAAVPPLEEPVRAAGRAFRCVVVQDRLAVPAMEN
jgi:peptide/nickel transport system ATP-binding protein